MTLISSVSGIRGTLGGKAGDNLTPIEVVLAGVPMAVGYCIITKGNSVVGRDADHTTRWYKVWFVNIDFTGNRCN